MTKTINNREYEYEAEYIDDSFEHEFGTQHQGFWEVTKVSLDGVDLPLEILSDSILKMLDDEANSVKGGLR